MTPKIPATPSGSFSVTSASKFCGYNWIWGKGGDAQTPYMFRAWFGRLRLHVFYRGDQDPDPHDHPWDFWTFPFVSYVEEITQYFPPRKMPEPGELMDPPRYFSRLNIVPAWRWTFRPAEHCHRVLGPYNEAGETDFTGSMPIITTKPGTIVTLVWRRKPKRAWGFLKQRDGRWCWVAWRDYVFGGGKNAPCE